MGTVSRVHTFSSGAILTAAQLNNEFDNLLTSSAINGGLDATNLGVTAGQATASKALVVDGSRNLADGTAGNRINNLALSGTFESTGGITATAGITSGGNIVSDTDSTDDLGTTSVRWANLYVDSIGDSGQALAVAATTLSFDAASTIDTSGNNNLTLDAGTATLTLDAATIESDASTLSFDAAATIDTSGNNNLSLDAGTATLTLDAGTIESDAGTLSFDGAASIDTSGNNALEIDTGSANLNITAGTLALTGAQTISGNLTVDTSTLVVDSSNNRVGIGHTAPDVLLHASAGGSDTSSLAGNTQAIIANTAASDSITRVAIIAGTAGFSVLDFGDSAASNPGGLTYNHDANSLSIGTTDGGADVVIDTDGRTLIGFSSSQGSAYKLQVNSQIFATSATVATSDQKYKQNVQSLTGATALVRALNPVQFDWKEHSLFNFDTDNKQLGFIAQEVQTALSDTDYVSSIAKSNSVAQEESTDVNGNMTPAINEQYLGIAEGNMIALLTAALQETIARVDALEN